ncbi:RING/U-box [Glarea lozoyensis ATCC 20868]|uniref:RING/U-box n=1 Tax=Glarea lozoyensis (strain ATCC 20868 / MF5171) TaxID=1116229 RepID=S3DER5_GLAL2|nr:RING/U-box [Glarea lozoyensis ATCC 20868]EPE35604.1 RING/U-box [Glarea lozoyensis ATCC 20868]
MAGRPSLAPFLQNSSLQTPGRSSNANSPWSARDGNDLDNLTLSLPPINPDIDVDNDFDLPPFLDSHRFFGVEPGASSSNTSGTNNLTSAPPSDRDPAHRRQPPPSDQQQSARPRARRSSFTEQYRISSSPDPYGSFIDLDDLQGLDDLEGFSEIEHQEQSRNTTSDMPATTRTGTRRASIVDLTNSPTQSRLTKRKRSAPHADEGHNRHKVARTAASPSRNRPSVPPKEEEEVEVVDLADVENEQQYQDLRAKKAAELSKKQALDEATRPVKLAQFNCIICMDQPTDLTVTHCGHMFCSECLHQALYAGDKKCCPVCRTAITMPTPRDKKLPSKGIFALEMKLMTRKKVGKQPMRRVD